EERTGRGCEERPGLGCDGRTGTDREEGSRATAESPEFDGEKSAESLPNTAVRAGSIMLNHLSPVGMMVASTGAEEPCQAGPQLRSKEVERCFGRDVGTKPRDPLAPRGPRAAGVDARSPSPTRCSC